jgi:aryl-alcohol dehydrogenase-like predicted oxidoreductase
MERPLAGSRIERAEAQGWSETWSAHANERTWAIIDALQEIAADTGHSVAQVAVNWLLRQPGVTAPILGARTLEQFEDNLGATGWALDEAQVARLDAVSDPGLPYPYDFVMGAQQRR